MEINDIFRIIDEFDTSTFELCKKHLYRILLLSILG